MKIKVIEIVNITKNAVGKIDRLLNIKIIFRSRGGNIINGLLLHNFIQLIDVDVKTVCLEQSSSIASILLASGTIGKRYSLFRSYICIHQPTINLNYKF